MTGRLISTPSHEPKGWSNSVSIANFRYGPKFQSLPGCSKCFFCSLRRHSIELAGALDEMMLGEHEIGKLRSFEVLRLRLRVSDGLNLGSEVSERRLRGHRREGGSGPFPFERPSDDGVAQR